jgi:hypothetical protein
MQVVQNIQRNSLETCPAQIGFGRTEQCIPALHQLVESVSRNALFFVTKPWPGLSGKAWPCHRKIMSANAPAVL